MNDLSNQKDFLDKLGRPVHQFTDRQLVELEEWVWSHVIQHLLDQGADKDHIGFAWGIKGRLRQASWKPSPGESQYMRGLLIECRAVGPGDVLED